MSLMPPLPPDDEPTMPRLQTVKPDGAAPMGALGASWRVAFGGLIAALLVLVLVLGLHHTPGTSTGRQTIANHPTATSAPGATPTAPATAGATATPGHGTPIATPKPGATPTAPAGAPTAPAGAPTATAGAPTSTARPQATATPIPPSTTPVISEYPINTASPYAFAAGTNGLLWYGYEGGIVRVSTATGQVANFPTSLNPIKLLLGPDGAIWFLLSPTNANAATALGRITQGGAITTIALPTVANLGGATAFCVGPDGNFWMPTNGGYAIAKVSASGSTTIYKIPIFDQIYSIVTGPDGALWFTSYNTSQIGRMTTSGVVTLYNLPTSMNGPTKMVVGPDNAFWIISDQSMLLARMTTSGTVTTYPVTLAVQPGNIQRPYDLATGPDGYLWYTDFWGNSIGRFNLNGSSKEYGLPNAGSRPGIIVAGPDGALWFSQGSFNLLGRITP